MGLMRLTADGMLDPLFDGDGMVAVDFDGNSACGECGRDSTRRGHCRCGLFVFGWKRTYLALLRVNGDGSLDSTFGDGGRSVIDLGVVSALNSIVVRADNSLAATGSRVNSESLD